MKRIIVPTLIVQFIAASAFGQTAPNRYEVELLTNPNAGKRDTREVNAVLVFEKDGVKIQSRRSKEVFRDFAYPDIRSVEHSYSKKLPYQMSNRAAVALAFLTVNPFFLLATEKEKHWLMVATDDSYAVLKIYNDNYRLIRMAFIIKKIAIVDIDER